MCRSVHHRDLHLEDRADPDARELVPAEVERGPDVVQVDNRDEGEALRGDFARPEQEPRDLARDRALYARLALVGERLLKRALRLGRHRVRRSLVLATGARHRDVPLFLRSTGLSRGGVEVRAGLVKLLRGNEPFGVELRDTLVGLVGEGFRGFRPFVDRPGRLDFLGPRAFLGEVRLLGPGADGGAGLAHLGFDLRNVELRDLVALLHLVAFLHGEHFDTARDLRRDIDRRRVDLSLEGLWRRMQSEPDAPADEGGDCEQHGAACDSDQGSFASGSLSVLFSASHFPRFHLCSVFLFPAHGALRRGVPMPARLAHRDPSGLRKRIDEGLH